MGPSGCGKSTLLKSFLTNDLIDDCNSFDKERIRKMARDYK